MRHKGGTIVFALSLFLLIFNGMFVCSGKRTGSVSTKVKNISKKSSNMNTFGSPDFAFPVTVCDNAEVAMREALDSGKDIDAVKALIQYSVAKMRISNDSVVRVIDRMDSVALRLSAPYRSIVYSLEAQMFKEMYMRDRWKYDQRNVNLTDTPADPEEWSADVFALKIRGLCDKSLMDSTELRKTGLREIEPLLDKSTISKDSSLYFPDLYAILSYRSLSFLDPFSAVAEEVIPFFSVTPKTDIARSLSDMKRDIASSLVNSYGVGSAAWCRAVDEKSELLPRWERYDFLMDSFKESVSSKYSGLILDSAGGLLDFSLEPSDNRNAEKVKEYYDYCNKYLEIAPSSPFAGNIKGRINDMVNERVDFSVRSQYTSAESIKISGTVANADSFYLLIYRLPSEKYSIDNKTVANVVASSKLCGSVRVTTQGDVPFRSEFTAVMEPQDYGRYFMVPSKDAAGKSIFPQVAASKYINLFRVSDLTTVLSTGADDDSFKIYVGSAIDLRPVNGADVTLVPNGWKARERKSYRLSTDAEGMASAHVDKDVHYTVRVTRGKDVLDVDSYVWKRNGYGTSRREVSWFTNLSVYHPGDTVKFALIAREEKQGKVSLLQDEKIKVLLRDANYSVADTLAVVTDSFGRASGSLRLPSGGLLGNFSLSCENYSGQGHFQVADYKSPTFFVEVDSVDNLPVAGDTIRISGFVKTYSGMPVQNADVKFNLRYWQPWFFRRMYAEPVNASYAGGTRTGADGRFSIELPTANLVSTPFANGDYILSVSATSASGETQDSEQTMFSIGRGGGLSLSFNIPDKIDAGKNGNVKVKADVTNIIGRRVNSVIDYEVMDSDRNRCLSGDMKTPVLDIPVSGLKSGRYFLRISLRGDTAVSQTSDFIVYRNTDKRPPVETPLWVPESKYVPERGERTVSIPFGSSYPDSYVYCEISDSRDYFERKLIEISDATKFMDIEVPEQGNRKYIRLIGMHNLNGTNTVVTVTAPEERSSLRIKQLSFRDRLVPGNSERWTFSVSDTTGYISGPYPMIATMSDKALNAIAPFRWGVGFSGDYTFLNPVSARLNLPGNAFSRYNFYRSDRIKRYSVRTPMLNLYGQPLYGGDGVRLRNVMTTSLSVRGASIPLESVQDEGSVEMKKAAKADYAAMVEESVVEENSSMEDNGGKADNVKLREISCPSAFFKPSLCTSDEGVVDISFDVPEFNTTWQFQLFGYSKELLSDMLMLDAVASKPVMVQMNAPRFLRTGDSTSLRVTLFNNTEESRDIQGVVEVFSVSDGKIISSMRSGSNVVAPASSVVVALDFDVPTDLNMIGVRAYAVSGDFTDGEQTLIGILPSSSPVIESIPIYLGPGKDFSLKLPKFDKDSGLMLSYCDNPVWFALTALPDITMRRDASLLSVADHLFANSVAAGLSRKYPQVAEAIGYWTTSGPADGDSTLISPLQKNATLKQFELGCTPWVANAESETLRMSHLSALLDAESNKKRISDAISEIVKSQSGSGGWSWTPGMQPSSSITGSVLLRMAMLKKMDMLPSSAALDGALTKAVRYCDSEIERQFYRYGFKGLDLRTMNNYLYIRSFYPDASVSPTMKNIISKSIAKIAGSWRDFNIYEMSTAAVLLSKSGYPQEARTILESLRQNAQHTPSRGMYFDNLTSGFNGMGRIITTMQALEAFASIEPDNYAVEELRQWIVMSRQTQDWQGSSFTPELIFSLLSSGAEWLTESRDTRVLLGSKEIEPSRVDRFTGSFTIPLNPADASGRELRIIRSGKSPAWGGLLSQQVLPMKDVKSYSTPDIKIEKAIYAVEEKTGATNLENRELRPGMKVRVQLTITSKRDAAYVSVKDERAACLEPVEQISQFTSQDNTWFYREIRDSSTNFFFSFLPEGTTMVSYDCYVDRTGHFSSGIATVQSLYSPSVTAHSGGETIDVAQ